METPIACTLSPDQYRGRTEELAALARRALRSRERTHDGERLVFAPGVEDQIRAAVEAEAQCCAFLSMTLTSGDAGLVLDIAGPPDARPVIAALFA